MLAPLRRGGEASTKQVRRMSATRWSTACVWRVCEGERPGRVWGPRQSHVNPHAALLTWLPAPSPPCHHRALSSRGPDSSQPATQRPPDAGRMGGPAGAGDGRCKGRGGRAGEGGAGPGRIQQVCCRADSTSRPGESLVHTWTPAMYAYLHACEVLTPRLLPRHLRCRRRRSLPFFPSCRSFRKRTIS